MAGCKAQEMMKDTR